METEKLNSHSRISVYLVCRNKDVLTPSLKAYCGAVNLNKFTDDFAVFCITEEEAQKTVKELGFDRYFYVSISVHDLLMVAGAAVRGDSYRHATIEVLECHRKTNGFEKVF